MAIGGVPLPLLSLTAFAIILILLLNFQRRLKS
jgi:disulfide bond formation protein DsbB